MILKNDWLDVEWLHDLVDSGMDWNHHRNKVDNHHLK